MRLNALRKRILRYIKIEFADVGAAFHEGVRRRCFGCREDFVNYRTDFAGCD